MSRNENDTIYAKIGGGDLLSDEDTKLCTVGKIIMDTFCPYSLQNDVAIIKIACEHQHIISLATSMPISNDADCLIFGYGSQSFDSNSQSSNLLRYGRVKPISYNKCEQIMGRAIAPIEGSGEFCAQGIKPDYADACGGVFYSF